MIKQKPRPAAGIARREKVVQAHLADVFVDRPMPSGKLFVPKDLRLDGEFLTWAWIAPDNCGKVTDKDTGLGMLRDFIRLHEASDAKILHYARTWGVLGICEHGLPCSHNQYPYGLHDGVRPCLPMLLSPRPLEGVFRLREPLAVWRAWSKKAQSLMNIAARLSLGKAGAIDDWRVVKNLQHAVPFEEPSEPFLTVIGEARDEFARELDGWISMGQVRPRVSWRDGKAKFSIDSLTSGPNLFGLLALNIAVATAAGNGERGFAVCSSCGLSYIPKRRPNANRRNYCQDCGLSAAQREASQRYRAKKNGRLK